MDQYLKWFHIFTILCYRFYHGINLCLYIHLMLSEKIQLLSYGDNVLQRMKGNIIFVAINASKEIND